MSSSENVFCAFCKSPKLIFARKRVGLLHIALSFTFGLIFNLVFWSVYDPRGLVLALVFILCSEVYIQLMWRLSLKCKECGFDPVLYTNDRSAAVTQVKFRLHERSQDPAFLLRPPLKLPFISLKRAESLANETPSVRGSKLNRQA